MEARKSVAISQQIENAFGVPHEASVSIRGGIIRGIFAQDQEWQRLIVLPDLGNDSSARPLKINTLDIQRGSNFRERSEQSFNLVAVRADKPVTWLFGIFETGRNQKKCIFGHATHHC